MSLSNLSSGSRQQGPDGHCRELVTIKQIQTGPASALVPEDTPPLGLPANTWGSVFPDINILRESSSQQTLKVSRLCKQWTPTFLFCPIHLHLFSSSTQLSAPSFLLSDLSDMFELGCE